jgi:hypothetical protein
MDEVRVKVKLINSFDELKAMEGLIPKGSG